MQAKFRLLIPLQENEFHSKGRAWAICISSYSEARLAAGLAQACCRSLAAALKLVKCGIID